MYEHERKQNAAGNDVVVVEVGGAGGGKFYQPNYIRVAEIEPGSEYTKINAKNVITDIAEYEFNHYAGRGPDSNYGASLDAAKQDLAKATAPERPPFEFEKSGGEIER